jgi:hypothetical protein
MEDVIEKNNIRIARVLTSLFAASLLFVFTSVRLVFSAPSLKKKDVGTLLAFNVDFSQSDNCKSGIPYCKNSTQNKQEVKTKEKQSYDNVFVSSNDINLQKSIYKLT